MTELPASGTQVVLRRGDARAVVVSLAAGLRRYERAGVDLVEGYGADAIAPGAAGITLAPFANRVDGGRWLLDGAPQQLDITEVPRGNAIHGLLRNTGYTVLSVTPFRAELEAVIHPQHGYPFLARHRVVYELAADGSLAVTQTLTNDSPRPAPFVLGAHPYLRVGDADPGGLTLTVAAATLITADDRLIPTGAEPVAGEWDLRAGRAAAAALMDTCFTDVAYDDGVARHTLSAADGRAVTLWHDESATHVHVFITTGFPGRPLAVAVEPMTGPANAFNSGDGLRWLEPGASYTLRWGIKADL
ncbi:aldose 1-epimerase family protein [Specibacter cremeus]|uniref:aldose 1-epimerase family protein n=1 Tax=Specibacter cremeus TaxID=1629051 RepID=UPI000F7812FE|nr:aldose 1-epimerase family protein [Specibacter cremeus]